MGAGASSTLQLTDLDQAGYERLAAAAGDHIDQDVARSFEALCAEGNQTLSLSVGLGEGSLAVTADPGRQQQAGLISLVGVGMGLGDEQQQAAAAQAARLAAQFEAEASPASRMSAKARRLSNALSNAAVPSSMTDAIDAKLRVSGVVPAGGLAGGVDLPGRLGDPGVRGSPMIHDSTRVLLGQRERRRTCRRTSTGLCRVVRTTQVPPPRLAGV